DSPQGTYEPSHSSPSSRPFSGSLAEAPQMPVAEVLSRFAAELALFAGVGFLLFAVNDLLVDLIYFARRLWRGLTVYSRHQRAYASYYVFNKNPGAFAIFVPAWDEAAVIAPMLRSMLARLDYDNYRIFVGYYRNDPA